MGERRGQRKRRLGEQKREGNPVSCFRVSNELGYMIDESIHRFEMFRLQGHSRISDREQ